MPELDIWQQLDPKHSLLNMYKACHRFLGEYLETPELPIASKQERTNEINEKKIIFTFAKFRKE